MNVRLSMSLLLFFVTVFSFMLQAQNTEQKLSKENYSYSADSLLLNLKTLSSSAFEGRRTGTIGAEKSRQYIVEKLKQHNVLPIDTSYLQPFSFESRKKNYLGTNVLGYIEGSEYPNEYIVISAHYDHEGIKNGEIYNGADDNASGVAALLAFTDYFIKNKPKHSIIIASFDAEELGLDGSTYFIANSIVPLEKIKLNINMDMISRNEKNQLYVTGTAFNETLKSTVSNYSTCDKITLIMGHDGKDGLQNWTYSGDHAPFYMKNIPFLYFGVEDHQDYHKPTDDFENIHPEFYKTAVETILDIFNLLDSSHL